MEKGSKSSHIDDEASTSNAAVSRIANGRERARRRGRIEIVDLTISDSDDDDYDTNPIDEAQLYEEWCMYRLSVDFRGIALPALETALKLFQGELGPAYKAVDLQCQLDAKKIGIKSSEEVGSLRPGGKLNRRPRIECPRFNREYQALQLEFQKLVGVEDLSSNAGGGLISHPGIACDCCYEEHLFEELVQCADGHLFCTSCLRRYVEECLFGASRTCGLPKCLDTNGCDKTIPWSEVKRALPVDVLSKYEKHQAEDAVAWARLEGLVYCPFCNHPWEVDSGLAVLRCRNEMCRKASCIKCKEPDHLPLCCEDVEKKSETSMRRKVEEVMTRAVVRECPSCKAELVKIYGCNKITCRCGQHMCYVCREPINEYSHFCQHDGWEPGQPCKICAGCSLFEMENETLVVEAARKAAMEEVELQEPDLQKRNIGPFQVEKPLKKQRY